MASMNSQGKNSKNRHCKAVNPTSTHSLCSHKGKSCYRTRSFSGCRRQSGPPAQSYADTCRRPEQRDKWPRGHKSGPIWPPAGPHAPVVELRVRSRSPPPTKNRRTVRAVVTLLHNRGTLPISGPPSRIRFSTISLVSPPYRT